MVWGNAGGIGIGDWVERLQANDPELTSLVVLASRAFQHQDVAQLCSALSSNSTLTDLNASGRPVSAETTQLFAEMLTVNTALTSLSIGDSAFGDEAAEILAPGLQANQTLQRLDLEFKGLTSRGVEALGNALEGCGLQSLNLAKNSVCARGAAALGRGMEKLRELNLSSCDLTVEALDALRSSASWDCQLERLHLDDNCLGPEGGPALARLLPSLPHLHSLSLRSCGLSDTGLAALTEALMASKVVHLNLDDNEIGPLGAKILAASLLLEDSPLETLKLRGNSLTDAGAEIMGAALKKAPLKELDMGSNRLGNGAVDLLRGGTGLVKLSIFNSRLGDMGGRQLASALSAAHYLHLQELDIAACAIDAEALLAIFTVLQAGAAPALELLLIGANPAVDLKDLEFLDQVEMLQAARPDLDVAWDTGANNSPGTPLSPPL